MRTLAVEEVQGRLRDIIVSLPPGEGILLTEQGAPLATLTRAARTSWPCKAGTAKDKILWISPDFDAPLEEFKEYME